MKELSRENLELIHDGQEVYVGPNYVRVTNPPPFGNYQPLFLKVDWVKSGNQVDILIQANP